jgi:signal transduction histidine kinase
MLSVSNTAAGGALNADKIFQRFYKEDQAGEGTGLGLAIVQEICYLAGFQTSYQFIDQTHVFTIRFA